MSISNYELMYLIFSNDEVVKKSLIIVYFKSQIGKYSTLRINLPVYVFLLDSNN